MRKRLSLLERFHNFFFRVLYDRSIVYNTCWEDPAVDKRALSIGPGDTILVITSAGCNALDYALSEPRAVYAVDANPRQTALLELKLAGIRALDHETFFSIFGLGRHRDFRNIYREKLRGHLSEFARQFWDKRWRWFTGRGWQNSFFWHGLSGVSARLVRSYLRLRPKLRRGIEAILEARDLEEQRRIFADRVEPYLWNRWIEWVLRRPLVLCLLGVTYTQRREIQTQEGMDVPQYIRAVLPRVLCDIPIRENYFWTVYIRGHYTRDCCPEYLKPENFEKLKGGLADRIHAYTSTVTEFLRSASEPITKFVLLDHMDWMSHTYPEALAEEWEAILRKAAPGATIIFRSGAARPTFLDNVRVTANGGSPERLTDRLEFERALAEELSRADRVSTYASFHIAKLKGAPSCCGT
ncbi:MAG: DUF3419 family protein [Planctomycetota bacterium]